MERETIKKQFISELISSTASDNIEVRRLTPSEAFRLQGLREDDISKLLDSGIPDTELYQLAGNSIAITCLQSLFETIVGKETVTETNTQSADKQKDICLDIVQIGNLIESKTGRNNPNPYRVYSVKGVSPTLMASMACGGRSPLIVKKNGEYL